ncbi:MAG: PEP-CTERM sorting domain-containing protein [Planctomycetota bacterium]
MKNQMTRNAFLYKLLVGTVVLIVVQDSLQAETITFDGFDTANEFGPNGVIIGSTHSGSPSSTATDIAGAPGEVRFTTNVSTGGSGLYGHFLAASYNPSVQAKSIYTIAYSLELRDPDLGSRSDGATTGFQMVLRQNGKYFYGPNYDPDDSLSGYKAFNGTAVESSFLENDGTPFGVIAGSHPDFSVSGSEIEFAVATASGTASSVITPVRVGDLRNFSFTLSVPEPSSFGILSLVLVGMNFRRRKKPATV